MARKITKPLLGAAIGVALVLALAGCGGSSSASSDSTNSDGFVGNTNSTPLTKDAAILALKYACTDLSDFVKDPASWEIVGSADSDPLDLEVAGGDGGALEITYTIDASGEHIAIPKSNFEASNWNLASSGCTGIDGLDLSVLEANGGTDNSGAQSNLVAMPDLLGVTETNARQYLFQNGFKMPRVDYHAMNPSVDCETNGWGLVVGTSPASGQWVDPTIAFGVVLSVNCEQ